MTILGGDGSDDSGGLTLRIQTPKRATWFLYRLFRIVMPLARAEIAKWTAQATIIPNEALRKQALSSLEHKRFHADGGAVYAAANVDQAPVLVKLIVALQTISDYLDNLCDRANCLDGLAFRTLHQSMQDAVTPGAPPRDYYAQYGSVDDGGYLVALVETCQSCVAQLPGYNSVQSQVSWAVARYSELQEFKHIDPLEREVQLRDWSAPYITTAYPDLEWWEFAAATGSTLGMFALFLAATEPVDVATAERVHRQYFPWICGLHILLDYLIDLDEDDRVGDFNFVACYSDDATAYRHLQHFAKESQKRTYGLPGGNIHRFVVHGLPAMYLSDPKVNGQKSVRRARRLVYKSGLTSCLFYAATMVYRKVR